MAVKNITEGVIRVDELYTLREFKRRLGLTDSAWRAMRVRGFRIIRKGKRTFVSGREAIEDFERNEHGDSREGHEPRPQGMGAAVDRSRNGQAQAEGHASDEQA